MKQWNIIGKGNTATIYEWEEGKVLKLFSQGYLKRDIEKEFHNSMAIRDMAFAKPKAYEIVFCEERFGIIYDRMKGESLLDWVLKTGDVQKCAIFMAELHKTILKNSICNVNSYKEFLKSFMINAQSSNSDKQEEVLKMIEQLPDGNSLCHGDFHPGNIFISGEDTAVIDFMNVCYGDYLYDIARTVFLVEYTPVPAGIGDRETILSFKKNLADLYLKQMEVTREMIQPYISVINIVRKYECPNEQLNIK